MKSTRQPDQETTPTCSLRKYQYWSTLLLLTVRLLTKPIKTPI